jgi:hypothetical protein
MPLFGPFGRSRSTIHSQARTAKSRARKQETFDDLAKHVFMLHGGFSRGADIDPRGGPRTSEIASRHAYGDIIPSCGRQ